MIIEDVTTPVVVLNAFKHGPLTLIRSLGRLGVPVYAVHKTSRALSLRSRYCRRVFELAIDDVPAEQAVEFLLRVADEIGGEPLLIPTEDVSCLFVEDNAPALREGFRFPERPDGLARALSSKRGMHDLCKEFDVPTPEAFFPASREEVVEFAKSAAFPVMVKAVDNRDLQHLPVAGKAVAANARNLVEIVDQLSTTDSLPELVLQEYIPGGADSVWMFNGYFDEGSECRFAVTGRKLRQYPAYVGQTSLGICEANPEVTQIVCDFMRAIGYTGILDLGFRYDARDGLYKLLDVNPRIGYSFRLFAAANDLDVARTLYLDMTGQPVPPAVAIQDRKWLVESYDVAASLTYWRDGRLRLRDWLSSFRGVDECAWFATDDLGPFGAMTVDVAGYVLRNSGAGLRRRLVTRLDSRFKPRRRRAGQAEAAPAEAL